MKLVRYLTYCACVAAYGLIVLGGVVRITGSGMGCGDHWPLCNGRLFPPLDDIGTVIEYSHRLAAALLSILVVGLAAVTFRHRSGKPFSRPAILALTLLSIQVLLGAVTVWLELPPWSVVLHLGAAMALFAVLLVLAMRAREGDAERGGNTRTWRAALGAAGLGGTALLLGALTANLGAAGACTGFPLCNGRVWPDDGGLAVIHWIHRLVGYALVLHLVGMTFAARRVPVSGRVVRAIYTALGLTLVQVAIAAIMILTVLQPHWRALHVAAGTAVWGAVVVLAAVSRPSSVRPT
jgi:heme A synthase